MRFTVRGPGRRCSRRPRPTFEPRARRGFVKKTATALKDNESETKDNESDRSARRGGRCLTESSALFVKQKNLTNRWATVLSCAQKDHFRYPSKQLQFFFNGHSRTTARQR